MFLEIQKFSNLRKCRLITNLLISFRIIWIAFFETKNLSLHLRVQYTPKYLCVCLWQRVGVGVRIVCELISGGGPVTWSSRSRDLALLDFCGYVSLWLCEWCHLCAFYTKEHCTAKDYDRDLLAVEGMLSRFWTGLDYSLGVFSRKEHVSKILTFELLIPLDTSVYNLCSDRMRCYKIRLHSS